MHYSISRGLLASPASCVSALQDFAIFDSPSWFRPVAAPIGSGWYFGVRPALLGSAGFWNMGESRPGSPDPTGFRATVWAITSVGGPKWPRSPKTTALGRDIGGGAPCAQT